MKLDSNTLDLISSLSNDRSIDGSSEIQISRQNTVSQKSSKKRKNNTPNDHMPKKEKRKEIVFSTTILMSTPLRDRIVEIGGSDIEIVIQKQLQDTDLNKNQGRLSIPIKKLINDFATEEEKKWLSQQDEDKKNKNGMKVLIIDPFLRETVIGLKLWKIGSDETYCLASEWNSLAQRNSLESGDYIQLWSFRNNGNAANQRVTSNLCFALVKLDISEGIFKFI